MVAVRKRQDPPSQYTSVSIRAGGDTTSGGKGTPTSTSNNKSCVSTSCILNVLIVFLFAVLAYQESVGPVVIGGGSSSGGENTSGSTTTKTETTTSSTTITTDNNNNNNDFGNQNYSEKRLDCGCPETCTQTILNQKYLGADPCRKRITWMLNKYKQNGITEESACKSAVQQGHCAKVPTIDTQCLPGYCGKEAPASIFEK